MRSILALILALALAPMQGAPARGDGLAGCEGHLRYGAPGEEGVLLCRLGYALAFNTRHKVADWVAYRLTVEKMRGNHPRSNDFRTDPDVPEGGGPLLADYRRSGYDRGHMAPAGAMKWDARAMSESFLLTNMAPQVGAGFNRGVWRSLEMKVRNWARARGEVYVVTGPIYLAEDQETIGQSQVSVPTHFYKVIFDPVRVEAIAFVLPNAKRKTAELPTFIRSVDDVEDQAHLDFLSLLEDTVEAMVEAGVQPGLWKER